MPYIDQSRRCGLDSGNLQASSAGDLNYMFTTLSLVYLENKGKSYQTINDIVGALEGCKLELYRRLAAPYEDSKAKINGDVYER